MPPRSTTSSDSTVNSSTAAARRPRAPRRPACSTLPRCSIVDLAAGAAARCATARPSTRAKGRKMPLSVTSSLCGPTTSSREVQPSSSGSKAPSRRGGGIGAGSALLGELDQAVLALDQLGGDRRQPGAGVAQRQPRPAGEVAVVGRARGRPGSGGRARPAPRRGRPAPARRASRGRGRRRAPCRPSARAPRSRAARPGRAGG